MFQLKICTIARVVRRAMRGPDYREAPCHSADMGRLQLQTTRNSCFCFDGCFIHVIVCAFRFLCDTWYPMVGWQSPLVLKAYLNGHTDVWTPDSSFNDSSRLPTGLWRDLIKKFIFVITATKLCPCNCFSSKQTIRKQLNQGHFDPNMSLIADLAKSNFFKSGPI